MHRCGRCRAEYGEDAWRALECVDRIVAARVRGLVTVWPDDVVVDIRRCRACGGAIARKQPAAQRSERPGGPAIGAGPV